MASKKVTFTGHDGSQLSASLELPARRPQAFALFAHCFTCGKDSVAAARISRALTDHGIAVMRFDFTGLGNSEGDFANTNFSSNVEDLVAAAAYLREHHQAPALLVGHSLGGAAVLAAAHEIPESVAVATLAAPAEPDHVLQQFGEPSRDEISRSGEATVSLAGRPFNIKRQFLQDLQSSRIDDCIAHLGKALLVMHSPLDTQVGVDSASRIFLRAKHPKSFVSLDKANHLLTRREDAEYAATVLAAWASHYLPMADATPLPAGIVEVSESGTGKFTQVVRSGRHVLAADEPADVGGDDAGPGPYDYLLAGLGACTSMTLRLYAERKQIPLQGVSVRLQHGRVHAEDCADCETSSGQIDQITRTLELTGDLSEAQHADLLRIADRCPVHRTLENEIKIRTSLASDQQQENP
ncbi:bifunctional alpha/beta hydrolase/OsmC family protein [Pseudoxanthomonas dokdonensis]|uniref:Osmotically inducible protein C n=1 Tax=Pseudoxanthomonas dokdonensis TaxID=344882 RepID=A0A0R0CQ04_9GAMM|nr:alpha/beta fold hydrolase [Pseudoxanthomonas dokdonensis]KRG72076.1 osmotically inducible protein C [Pseudoxanthomonas dokdonensis]